jgi:hypothetical protein
LVELYTPKYGSVIRPPTLDTLMIRPARRARMAGRNARVTAIRPNTLVSYCRRSSASEISDVGPSTPNPALLISASSPRSPVSRATASTAAAIDSDRVTSSGMVSSLPASPWASVASRASSVGLRPLAITWWPSRARWRAVVRPMPAVAPVMRTVFEVDMAKLLGMNIHSE